MHLKIWSDTGMANSSILICQTELSGQQHVLYQATSPSSSNERLHTLRFDLFDSLWSAGHLAVWPLGQVPVCIQGSDGAHVTALPVQR